MFIHCGECGKAIPTNDVKYHTPAVDGKILHGFCDAYSSFAWYDRNNKYDNDRETNPTTD